MSGQQGSADRQSVLQFHGGIAGLLAPFFVLFAGILWLGLRGVAIPEALWPVVILALFVGLLLARSHRVFVETVISGIASPMLAIMLLAWFLAGILGTLLSRTGVIDGLIWIALAADVPVSWLPLAAFLIAAGLSLATGTSIGAILAATPVLFPSGTALGADPFLLLGAIIGGAFVGADPFLLLGAIIGGAFVGDNLAPISDTTIVSAYSQGTEVTRVVRSRLRYAAVAGGATLLLYVSFALSAGGAAAIDIGGGSAPDGLLMLVVPAALIAAMMRGSHLVSALLYSVAAGLLLGLGAGLIGPSDILSIDSQTFTVGGIIVDGIQGMLGIAVFSIFLLGLSETLDAGGLVDWMMGKAERFATTPTRAEVSIVGVSLALNGLSGAGTPSMIILGPFVRRLGHRFGLAPWRRGNLLDACSTTIVGIVPHGITVLIAFALASSTAARHNLQQFTPVYLVPYAFYCWFLMLTIIAAAITGWGREFCTREEAELEAREMHAGWPAGTPPTKRSKGRQFDVPS